MQFEQMTTEQLPVRFTFEEARPLPAKIMVIGVGGAGGNAINRMIQSGIEGVELIAANTDIQALQASQAPIKLQLGAKITHGLGCGGCPELGRKAAMEDTERLIELLEGADMVFVTGGMGGGTCTGAAPVIAGIAAEVGALTVAVVSRPFRFLGNKRRAYAEEGIRELKEVVDTIITIPNENLLRALGQDALLEDALRYADDVLCQAVQGICDIITKSGIINVDLADVRTIMARKGMAIMGTGIAEGVGRSTEAAQVALSSPLLENVSIKGAKAVLMNITGTRSTLRLHETEAAARVVEDNLSPDDMILGAVYDESMGDRIKVTIIATGIGSNGDEQAGQAGTAVTVPSGGRPQLPGPAPVLRTTIDSDVEPAASNLDEPAFRRRRAV